MRLCPAAAAAGQRAAAGQNADTGLRRPRAGLGGAVDITQLILDDHHEQRRLFAILEQLDDPAALEVVWGRLAAFLELHAEAEEEIFYPALLQAGLRAGTAGQAEDETLDAIGDHNDIRDAIAAVAGHQAGSPGWRDAIAAVNVANGDHMAEEEREGLTDFRREASLQRRHDLAAAFAAFEARNVTGVRPVDQDPEQYVQRVERALPGSGQPGSLGIGSLRGT